MKKHDILRELKYISEAKTVYSVFQVELYRSKFELDNFLQKKKKQTKKRMNE